MVLFVGGILLIFMIIVGLWGGVFVDVFDWWCVLIISVIIGWFMMLGLIVFVIFEVVSGVVSGLMLVWLFYLLIMINVVVVMII